MREKTAQLFRVCYTPKARERERNFGQGLKREERKSFLPSHRLISRPGVPKDQEGVLDRSPTKDSTWCPLTSSTKSERIGKKI